MGALRSTFFLSITPKICETTLFDLSHLCDLEIIKPVEHGEVDLFIGSDYFEKLLLPLEHGIGKPREAVGHPSDGQLLDISWR